MLEKDCATLECVLAIKDKKQIDPFLDILEKLGGSHEFSYTIRIDTNNLRRALTTGLIEDIDLKTIKFHLQDDGWHTTTDSETPLEETPELLAETVEEE